MSGAVEDANGKRKINARACLKWVWENPAIPRKGYTLPDFVGKIRFFASNATLVLHNASNACLSKVSFLLF